MRDADDDRPRCRRCGRCLKTPESVAAGIGPVCLAKEQLEAGEVKRIRPGVKGSKPVFDPRQMELFPLEP